VGNRSKLITLREAVGLIPDGATLMVGGFMGCGNPHKLIDELSKSGKGGFTLICNDAALIKSPTGED
jgi:acetate CoA/acetoacetate CoA-transferase alpha subunit